MFELREIQRSFMRHFGVSRPEDLHVPDGFYIVPVYDTDFNVRVWNRGASFGLCPPAEFDQSKATRIGTGIKARSHS